MGAIIGALLESILPILVQEAEKLLGGKPDPKNHEWVVGLIDEICKLFESKLPGFIRPSEEMLKQLIEDALKKLLDKLPE